MTTTPRETLQKEQHRRIRKFILNRLQQGATPEEIADTLRQSTAGTGLRPSAYFTQH